MPTAAGRADGNWIEIAWDAKVRIARKTKMRDLRGTAIIV
jgi:hypothetical protein